MDIRKIPRGGPGEKRYGEMNKMYDESEKGQDEEVSSGYRMVLKTHSWGENRITKASLSWNGICIVLQRRSRK